MEEGGVRRVRHLGAQPVGELERARAHRGRHRPQHRGPTGRPPPRARPAARRRARTRRTAPSGAARATERPCAAARRRRRLNIQVSG